MNLKGIKIKNSTYVAGGRPSVMHPMLPTQNSRWEAMKAEIAKGL